ncbi:GNAT family N-acetyltransferase, partial [Streptomyces sp. NPDC002920]
MIATHRRRGYLRQMMQAMFEAALDRGEPLAMLSASEGSIYGRFGFSPATYRVRWELDRHEAALLPAVPDPGSLELVDATQAKQFWPMVHAEVRTYRVGELTPLPGRWDGLSDGADGTNGPLRYLVHRDQQGDVDGIANFRLPWSSTVGKAGTLVVEALEATNPVAYRALWSVLVDFDLTKTIVAPGRPRDEPLRWMLANPRAASGSRKGRRPWPPCFARSSCSFAIPSRPSGSLAAVSFRSGLPADQQGHALTTEVDCFRGRKCSPAGGYGTESHRPG